MNRLSKTLAIASATFAVGGGTALAQDPAAEVYNPNGGVLDVVQSATPTPTPAAAPETEAAPETTATPSTPAEETETTPAAEATPVATATPSTTQEAQTGDLPFTGFEAGFVAMAGLALLGGGLAMRRAARER